MPPLYKIIAGTLAERIKKKITTTLAKEQFAYRSGVSTINPLYIVKQVMEKAWEWQKSLAIGLLDMSKAFDVICMRTVWKALKKYGVDEETIQMVMKLYKVDNNVIRIGSNEEEFRQGRGVRQGDAMSPILFVLGLQYALDKIDWQEMGIDINGTKLRILIYADDITILANNAEELKEMTEKVEEATTRILLRMNKEKTCWMGNVEGVLRIQNMEIQKTEKCKYLGQTLTFPNEHGEEIKDRIRSGWCKFQEVKWLLMNKKTPTSLKAKYYKMCIEPALLYGAETWAWTKADRIKLSRSQKKMERMMCNVKLRWGIRSKRIRRWTGLDEVVVKATERKWKFGRKVARMPEDR